MPFKTQMIVINICYFLESQPDQFYMLKSYHIDIKGKIII